MWFWERNKSWLGTPEISAGMLDWARSLETAEAGILQKCGNLLLADAVERELLASNAIEGVFLDPWRLRPAIAERFGFARDAWIPGETAEGKESRAVKALSILMGTDGILTHDAILEAHAAFETCSGAGAYRDHPESVFDGNGGTAYEAPPAEAVPGLMDGFLFWHNTERPKIPKFLGSALAHFLFVAIHPFRDGNGRMARMLAYAIDRPFYMSGEILKNRNAYYDSLARTQRTGDFQDFLRFMIEIRESALTDFDRRADRLSALRSWMSERILGPMETAILQEMALQEKWTFFDATRNIPDGEAAEAAWDNLAGMDVVGNGRPIFEIGEPGSEPLETIP